MKALKIILSVIGVFVVIIVIGLTALNFSIKKTTSTYKDFDFGSLDLSAVEDGTYTGSEDGKFVKASVEVTVKDHQITNVTILSHECGKGKPAEVITEDIVAHNSLEVDAISGATYSSDVIRVAAYNALTTQP